MKKKNKIRKCSYCGHKFEVFPTNPQKEYCSGTCWCLGNDIDKDKMKHFLGGHKNMKRKKKKKKK